jgi:hypothetical protein
MKPVRVSLTLPSVHHWPVSGKPGSLSTVR